MRRLGGSFRRARRIAPKAPSPAHRARVEAALTRLHRLEDAGRRQVWYGDESGFCLQPVLPYLWQEKGKTLGLPAQAHSKRLNALGFLRRNSELVSVTTTETVKADHLIAAVETLIAQITLPSVLVLDNASVHRSKFVQEKRKEWKQKGLRLLFLPPYSPHLNKIETLWRLMKYHWLSPCAYADFATLRKTVEELLAQVGKKFRISFA